MEGRVSGSGMAPGAVRLQERRQVRPLRMGSVRHERCHRHGHRGDRTAPRGGRQCVPVGQQKRDGLPRQGLRLLGVRGRRHLLPRPLRRQGLHLQQTHGQEAHQARGMDSRGSGQRYAGLLQPGRKARLLRQELGPGHRETQVRPRVGLLRRAGLRGRRRNHQVHRHDGTRGHQHKDGIQPRMVVLRIPRRLLHHALRRRREARPHRPRRADAPARRIRRHRGERRIQPLAHTAGKEDGGAGQQDATHHPAHRMRNLHRRRLHRRHHARPHHPQIRHAGTAHGPLLYQQRQHAGIRERRNRLCKG